MQAHLRWNRTPADSGFRQGLPWWKPWTSVFRNNPLRKEVSGYPNYIRIVWFGRDITLEWS